MKYSIGEVILKNKTCYRVVAARQEGVKFKYEVYCLKCGQDSELFGEATFETFGETLKDPNKYICGCGKYKKWTPYQYQIKVNRKLPDNFKRVSFENITTNKLRTKDYVKLSCTCGSTRMIKLNDLLTKNAVCVKCTTKMRPLLKEEELQTILRVVPKSLIGVRWDVFTGKVKTSYFKYSCSLCGDSTRRNIDYFRSTNTVSCRNGCENRHRKRSPEIFDKEVKSFCKERGVKFLTWEGTPNTIYSKFFWECFCGYRNKTSFDNFSRGKGCRFCKTKIRGYNGIGYLYLSEWDSTFGTLCKIGITKQTRPLNRVMDYKKNSFVLRNTNFKIYQFKDYTVASGIEGYIKSRYCTDSIPNHLFREGSTETITKVSFAQIQEVLEYYMTLAKSGLLYEEFS